MARCMERKETIQWNPLPASAGQGQLLTQSAQQRDTEDSMKRHLQPLTLAALYARVSSDRQDVDVSVAAQMRALRDYARANGYSIARRIVDEESGRIADRPEFRKMIEEGSLCQRSLPSTFSGCGINSPAGGCHAAYAGVGLLSGTKTHSISTVAMPGVGHYGNSSSVLSASSSLSRRRCNVSSSYDQCREP